MIPESLVVRVLELVLIATIAIGLSGSLLAWRERPEPGAVPLAALLAGQCWWSATLFFRINATDLAAKVFWVDVSWPGVALIPLAWLLFALEYSGYTRYVRRRYVAALAVVPAVTVVLGLTGAHHELLYVDSTLVDHGGITTLDRTPGPWFWVIAGYTYLLGAAGVVPLLQLVRSRVVAFRGQSVAILTGVIVPWVTNVLFVSGVLPTAGVDPTPIAFAVSGIAYLGALTRFRLFGTSPSPIRYARRLLFDRMAEGAVVLDSHDNVVEMNQRAFEILDTTAGEALGRPATQVVPEFERVDSGSPTRTIVDGETEDRAYDVSVRPITDAGGRTIGRIVTLHDISDLLRQQQRLEVLNRVFRHNIRTNTQIILGHADYLAHNNSERKATKVKQTAVDIQEISEKVREILDLFKRAREGTASVPLDPLLRECVGSVREAHPGVDLEYDPPADEIHVDESLTVVFENAVENAAQHNTDPDPRVRVAVERAGDYARVVVEDNGPGIDEHEFALLEQGTETPLEHGSGLGLSLIVWGTDVVGGRVSIEDNEPTGTVITLEVPVLSPSPGSGGTDQPAPSPTGITGRNVGDDD